MPSICGDHSAMPRPTLGREKPWVSRRCLKDISTKRRYPAKAAGLPADRVFATGKNSLNMITRRPYRLAP